MILNREVLIELLKRDDVNDFIKDKSFLALRKIKAVIENDSLSDFDCVEAIVRVFEEMGSDGGGRHDFG